MKLIAPIEKDEDIVNKQYVDNKVSTKVENTEAGISATLNKISNNTSNATDTDVYITRVNNKYYKRSLSHLWNWIKTKVEALGYTKNIGTLTGIKMNGVSKGTSGVVDLGKVLTGGSQTTTSTEDGGNNVYTFSDNSTITIRNGTKGSKGDIGPQGPRGEKGDPGTNATTTAVATSTSNGLMSSTDKKNLDILKTPLAICTTPRSTAAKVATLANFTLTIGSTIAVKFTDTGTANPTTGNLTLNVNNTGAKNIGYFRNGSKSTFTYPLASFFYNNVTRIFTYDGTYWLCMDYNPDNDTHYTTHMYTGENQATAHSTTAVNNPYINILDNTTYRNSTQLKAGTDMSISAKNGIVTFNSTSRRHCYAGFTGKADSTKPWFKFASTTITTANYDNTISFKVNRGYGDLNSRLGILTAHVRTNDPVSLNPTSSQLYWEYKGDPIPLSDFKLAYKNALVDSKNYVYVDLYFKDTSDYVGYSFEVIQESSRTNAASKVWSLLNNTTGIASIPSDYSTIDSQFAPLTINNANTVNGHTVLSNVPANAKFTDTDTKVTNTLNTTTKAYITGTTSSTTNTGTQIFDTGVYLDTTAGVLSAGSFKGGHQYNGIHTAWSYNNINSDFEKGNLPTSAENPYYWDLNFTDKNGVGHANRIGYIETGIYNDGRSKISLNICENKKSNTNFHSISITTKKQDDGTFKETVQLGSKTLGATNKPIYLHNGVITEGSACLPLTGGTMTGSILANKTDSYNIGSSDIAFNSIYAKAITHYSRDKQTYKISDGTDDNSKLYGYLSMCYDGSSQGGIFSSSSGLIVRPATNNTGNVGLSTNYFANGYFTNIRGRAIIKIEGTSNKSIDISSRKKALVIVTKRVAVANNKYFYTTGYYFIDNTTPSTAIPSSGQIQSSCLTLSFSLSTKGIFVAASGGIYDKFDIILFD